MPDARKFSRERHRIKLNHREVVELRLRSLICDVLRDADPTAVPGAVDVISELTAAVASQLLCQTQSGQRALKTLREDIGDYAAAFVEQIVRDAKKDVRLQVRRTTAAAAAAAADEDSLPLADDWAGPVAGPTIIERHFGIPRSTLYRWQKRKEVVWLNTRTSRKPVFPLRQFVDGRPAKGIAEIVQAFGDPRSAWQWLMKPIDRGDRASPLEKLLDGDVTSVLAACKTVE